MPNPAATTTERVPKTRRHSQLRELRRHLSKIIRQEVLKRIAPVARSVSWNVTAVAGNAWRILPPRTDSQNKATLSVAGGLAERVCDFLDTHVINYQTCRARAIGASSPQMVFCSQDAGGLRLVLESSKRATVTLTLKC